VYGEFDRAPTLDVEKAIAGFKQRLVHDEAIRAGRHILHRTARMPMAPSITNVTCYAALGAFYFLVSAMWLTVGQLRRKAA
jgi:hypothetical protein